MKIISYIVCLFVFFSVSSQQFKVTEWRLLQKVKGDYVKVKPWETVYVHSAIHLQLTEVHLDVIVCDCIQILPIHTYLDKRLVRNRGKSPDYNEYLFIVGNARGNGYIFIRKYLDKNIPMMIGWVTHDVMYQFKVEKI